MGSTRPAFELKDSPIENQRPLKVRVIGAGYSGIYMGIRIPQWLKNIDLRIYEKNEGVGGAWYENRYPGCACDIPSHSYQYSFAPNPNWSAIYAPQKEICAYLEDVATKFGAMRFVQLQHKVKWCKWNEEKKIWNLKIEKLATGEIFDDEANVLISARGNLNEISWPDIKGLETFKGEIMHSAAWNEKYDFTNKRIGVIGSGSSAIQIVPSLQRIEGTQLSCFVRSSTWIASPFADASMVKLGLDPSVTAFSEDLRTQFKTDPTAYHTFRKTIEVDGNVVHEASLIGSPMQSGGKAYFSSLMTSRLISKPEIIPFLIPSFSPGCRRLTPGPGYLEALVAPNVDFVSTGIECVTGSGVELADGRAIELDVLVCATGFKTSAPPPFDVIGVNNTSVAERWTPFPETYLSLAVDGFPNYFLMLGPNSAIGSGSLTKILEQEGDYILVCIRKLQKEDYASMSVKAARVADFSEFCETYFKGTVYGEQCSSWYKTGERVTGLWPGSTLHALEAMRRPRWEDWEWESVNARGNELAWLGNGWSVTLLGEGDPAWYIEEGEVDVPVEGEPERAQEKLSRPWG